MGEGSGAPGPPSEAHGGPIDYRPMNYRIVGTECMAPANPGQASKKLKGGFQSAFGQTVLHHFKKQSEGLRVPGCLLEITVTGIMCTEVIQQLRELLDEVDSHCLGVAFEPQVHGDMAGIGISHLGPPYFPGYMELGRPQLDSLEGVDAALEPLGPG